MLSFFNGTPKINIVKNQYHNGHPDLIPKGKFPEDSVQYSDIGLEVKASRHSSPNGSFAPEARDLPCRG